MIYLMVLFPMILSDP